MAQPATSQPSTSGDTSGTTSKVEKKALIKDCVAKQQASNSGMSKHDAKKYCKQQVDQAAPQ